MNTNNEIPKNIKDAISESPYILRAEATGFPQGYAQYRLLGFDTEDGWVEIGRAVESEDLCALVKRFAQNWGNAIAKKQNSEKAEEEIKIGDVVTLRVGIRCVTGPCRVVEIGPAPAPGKLGCDWAGKTYTVKTIYCNPVAIARGLLVTDIRKVEDGE